jgi:D-alanyl-D-alanine carboxypeptidase/D-alanyl-D-alanine-endopeptidase (penicillin-binding protein 4)
LWRLAEKLVAVNGDTIDIVGVIPELGEKALHLRRGTPISKSSDRSADFGRTGRHLRGQVRGNDRPAHDHYARIPTLGEVIREVNKYSNNVMARQLFLSLSPTKPATAEAARRRIQTWLDEKGLSIPELQIDNGSGLSRSERISATGLGQLLLAAWKSSVMPELMASLPVAGVDGTLKKRLGDTTAGGRAHLKTGYLEGVRAIAGYVLDASGKRWVVVFLINDTKARLGKPAMDALVRWVAER